MKLKINYIILLLIISMTSAYAEKTAYVDSLLSLLGKSDNDSTKAVYYNNIARYYQNFDFESSRFYAEKSLSLTTGAKQPNITVDALFTIGNSHYLQGNYSLALDNYLMALKVMQDAGSKSGVASAMLGVSNIYSVLGDSKKALEFLMKCLKIREELGDSVNMAVCYNNIASVFTEMRDYDKALEYNFLSLGIKERRKMWPQLSSSYGNIGSIYQMQGKLMEALNYQKKALKIRTQVNNQKGMVMSYTDVAKIYADLDRHNKAIGYYLKALALAREIGRGEGVKAAMAGLSVEYEFMNKHKLALRYHKKYSKIKDSLDHISRTDKLLKLQTQFEASEKENEIKLLKKNKEIDKLRIDEAESQIARDSSYMLLGGIALLAMLFVSMSYYARHKLKRVFYKQLVDKNKRIELQSKLIAKKNESITDSLVYAQKLQNAILPSAKMISQRFSDYFVFHRAKDIVSGDFYWYYQTEKSTFLFVGDCTGHGVPGAFLAIAGSDILNHVVKESGVSNAGEILSQLNIGIQETFSFDSRDEITIDGMDCTICIFNREMKTIEFAGARNHLWITRAGQDIQSDNIIEQTANSVLIEYRGEKRGIGGFTPLDHQFISHTISVQPGDNIYMFSDGYKDQFGGLNGKKFKRKKFKELMLGLTSIRLPEQKKEIEAVFDAWMEGYGQVDDVCIVGVRV